MQLKVLSVNISEKKGTIKMPQPFINLNDTGVKDDAHSGNWHRQVSLLGNESIQKMNANSPRKVAFGELAENITTEGINLFDTNPLDKLYNANIELEITQIGKKCHGSKCSIFKEVGNCIMPTEGIFARVVKSGKVQAGDILNLQPKVFKIKIITVSDRASTGEYEDKSGPQVKSQLNSFFDKLTYPVDYEIVIVPDEENKIATETEKAITQNFDAIFTTGGTGIGPRDITPDVIKPFLEKELPGIMELIRVKYGMEKPNALISRSIAGISRGTLIYVLPGSVKAVNEYMHEILPTFIHSIFMLKGIDRH